MVHTLRITDKYNGSVKITIESWVKWMAVDQSGSLWGFSKKPIIALEHAAWLENAQYTLSQFIGNIKPPKDYKQELYTWS